MVTTELVRFFDERYAEIGAYLSLLQNVEDAARGGPPRFEGTDAGITAEQKKIMSSSFYLQLYNLVEATILRCLEAVVGAVEEAKQRPGDLGGELRKEWVRAVARTHTSLGPEKRLEAALDLCDALLEQIPVRAFTIETGGGGNWDDSAIEKVCERVGCSLTLSPSVKEGAKRHFRDEMGALNLVKDRRNGLAHGSLSFVDCSDDVTVTELRRLSSAVGNYLREAVDCFVKFIQSDIGLIEAPAVDGTVAP